MKTLWIIKVLILIVIVNPAYSVEKKLECAPLNNVSIIGIARDKQNNIMYCEYHFVDEQLKYSKVEYRKGATDLIAVKEVNYTHSLLAPNIKQIDVRHGELRSVIKGDVKNIYQFSYLSPNKAKDKQKKKDILSDSSLVIDAGFDHAIRKYWDDLLSSKKIVFPFAILPRLSALKLRVKKTKKLSCGKQSYKKERYSCFMIKPSSTVVSLLVKPIYLLYENDSKILTYFEGQVNITDDLGKSQRAAITYHYYQ